MSNQLEIPILNSFKYVPVNPAAHPEYNTKFNDDYIFEDTIYDWQEFTHRFQPVRTGDKFPHQFTSNFAPILLQLVDCNGNVFISQNAMQVRANKYNPGFYLYETTIDTTGLPDGLYRALITPGGSVPDQQKSEWLYIAANQPHTIAAQYFNNRYHGDVVFETGIVFLLRLPGFFEYKAPGSIDVLYADQVLDQVQLSSRLFNNKTLYIGDGSGVPPWMIEKMNFAFSCSNVTFDGKLLAKADSAKWTEFAQDGSAVKGYAIDVRDGINRSSRIINPSIDPTKKITLLYFTDNSVFGSMAPTGGTIVTPITATE